jgi:hypothetical protein
MLEILEGLIKCFLKDCTMCYVSLQLCGSSEVWAVGSLGIYSDRNGTVTAAALKRSIYCENE